MLQLWKRRTKKEFEENPGTNPILFICKYLCFHFIVTSHAACPRLYCTVHTRIAVGHSWLAKPLTLVVCLKMCVKNHCSSGVDWWWQTISNYMYLHSAQPGQQACTERKDDVTTRHRRTKLLAINKAF